MLFACWLHHSSLAVSYQLVFPPQPFSLKIFKMQEILQNNIVKHPFTLKHQLISYSYLTTIGWQKSVQSFYLFII